MIRTLAATVVLCLSTSAFAGWSDAGTMDIWDSRNLDWAQELHPDALSDSQLLALPAPPREQWCPAANVQVFDDDASCDLHDDAMDAWVHDFLGLAPNESLPDMDYMPSECNSACQPSY